MRLEVIGIPVADVDWAKAFFVEQVGLGLPQRVVADIDAVRAELAGRGVPVSEVQQLGPEGAPGSRFAFFTDPDGNGWRCRRYGA